MLGVGRVDESERLATGVLSYHEKNPGPSRRHTLRCMILLAGVKKDTNRLDGAEQDLVRVIQEARSAFGEKDHYTTLAMARLGHMYTM